jgi:hypothetical protein
MKHKILIITLLGFGILGLGFMSPSYASLTSGNYEIEMIPHSGGALELKSGAYSIQDMKGLVFYQCHTSGTYKICTGLNVLVSGIVTGGVPLTISVSGNDIKLTWDNNAYQSVDIYYLDVTSTQNYSNDTNWQVLKQADTDGLYLDTGQASATGVDERYYKGLLEGTSPTATDPQSQKTFIAAAVGVGKIKLSLNRVGTSGWNYVAYPFKAGNVSTALYGSFSNGDSLRIWDETNKQFTQVVKYNNGWPSFTLTRGKGYLFYRSLTTPVTATMVGEVDLTNLAVTVSRKGASGWNFLGTPFPGRKTMGQLNPTEANTADSLRIWNESTKQYTQVLKKAAWSSQNVEAGTAYTYYRAVPASYVWTFSW